jgi:hypothetical protein
VLLVPGKIFREYFSPAVKKAMSSCHSSIAIGNYHLRVGDSPLFLAWVSLAAILENSSRLELWLEDRSYVNKDIMYHFGSAVNPPKSMQQNGVILIWPCK